jgi:hypothetical protein
MPSSISARARRPHLREHNINTPVARVIETVAVNLTCHNHKSRCRF